MSEIDEDEYRHSESDDEFSEVHEDTKHIGRAPRCTFGLRWSQTSYISKLHAEAEPGVGSPGVGDYKLRKDMNSPGKKGKHFGTSTKDLLPTRYEGPASAKASVSHASPGPKYNTMPTETRAVPSWKIGTSKRPPLNMPNKGPGPGAYSPIKAPSTIPAEFSFGNSPDHNRFAQNMYTGSLSAKAIPVIDTPGPVYQIRTKTDDAEGALCGPFDRSDRFEPLKHLMISDEHNKRMGESANDYPAANTYMTTSFPQPEKTRLRRNDANPPSMKPEKSGVYKSGVSKRFSDTVYAGKGALVGLGKEGGGPGAADVPTSDVTLKTDGPIIPRAARNVGSKSSVSQVPGPGAYKPPLKEKLATNFKGRGMSMGLNRRPPSAQTRTPAPNTYSLTQPPGLDQPKRAIGNGARCAKVYLSAKHTQDIKGLDSPGPVYHYQQEKDIGTGHTALIGTADRNKSEAKRFISKMHTADTVGVDTPGPGTYGGTTEELTPQASMVSTGGGYSFGSSERKTGGPHVNRNPGPGTYVKPSTLRKGGFSFGGGPSRC